MRLEEITKIDNKWVVVSDRREIDTPNFVRGPLMVEQKPLEGEDVFLRKIHDQAPRDSRFYQRSVSHCYRNGCIIKVTPINYWR